jgi:hypothetical protein
MKYRSSYFPLVELITSVIVFYMQNMANCKNQAILENVVGTVIWKSFYNLICYFKFLNCLNGTYIRA